MIKACFQYTKERERETYDIFDKEFLEEKRQNDTEKNCENCPEEPIKTQL